MQTAEETTINHKSWSIWPWGGLLLMALVVVLFILLPFYVIYGGKGVPSMPPGYVPSRLEEVAWIARVQGTIWGGEWMRQVFWYGSLYGACFWEPVFLLAVLYTRHFWRDTSSETRQMWRVSLAICSAVALLWAWEWIWAAIYWVG